MTTPATQSHRAIAFGVIFFLAITLNTTALAECDLADALRECATVEDHAARLACFDDIADSMVAADDRASESAAAAAAPVDDDQPKPLSDDVGKGAVSGEEAPRTIYAATVTRCEHVRRRNQFFFFLENGQVWEMSNFRRPIVGECRFDVTIEQDFFGFRMDIPSKGASFRVSRVR